MRERIIIICIFTMALCILVSCGNNSNPMNYKESAEKHLKIYYPLLTAELIDEKEGGANHIFLFTTKDGNEISFEVKCWKGRKSSPWGYVPFTSKIHCSDDFLERINDYVVSDYIDVDVSGQSYDQIVQLLKTIYNKVCEMYVSYGVDEYTHPYLSVPLLSNGREYIVKYDNIDEDFVLPDGMGQ